MGRKHLPSIKVTRKGSNIGDQMLASLFVHVLTNNNIDAVLECKFDHLCNCPKPVSHNKYTNFEFRYEDNNYDYAYGNIVQRAINAFNNRFHTNVHMICPDHIPVHFRKLNTPNYDVVMSTKSSGWTLYKEWPYFTDLKHTLRQMGISSCDISYIHNYACLNYVNNAKIYVGIDNGMAHYVSQFANNKAIIIQSGYTNSEFWCYYNYDIIKNKVHCSPCSLRSGCIFNHACMSEIKVNTVIDHIKRKLTQII
ncbi:MAG: hypothetical protein GF411_14185 [Candidatus Lokiarchaeota archaeon]|nr:hypothetical protein [Candidatus Lokiarchaeota archaeon]